MVAVDVQVEESRVVEPSGLSALRTTAADGLAEDDPDLLKECAKRGRSQQDR